MVIFECESGNEAAFNLTEHELMELEVSTSEGFTDWMKKSYTDGSLDDMLKILKIILLRAYGKLIVLDNTPAIVKNAVLTEDFEASHDIVEIGVALIKSNSVGKAFFDGLTSAKPIRIRKRR